MKRSGTHTDSLFSRTRRLLVALPFVLILGACGDKQSDAKPSAKEAEKSEAGHEDKDGLKLSPEELRRAGVKVEALRPQQVAHTIGVTATVRPNQDRVAQIAPRVEGRIVRVSANLGDRVPAGHRLAVLDSLAVGEASSSLLQAQSAARLAQSDLKRAETLSAEEIIPQKELLRARAEAEKAAAAVRAAQDKLRLLGVSPTESGSAQSVFPVTAPFGGTVIEKKATVGQLANPSEALFAIADLSKVWIEANLPETLLAKVRIGAQVTVTVAAYPADRFAGRITYIANVLDKEKRTIPARVEVDNRDGRLKLDMFATVNIEASGSGAGENPEMLMVPDEAIVLMQGQPTVFVQEHGGFEARPIDAGEKLGGRTVVKSGLAANDQVVMAGAYALKARLLKSQIGDSH